MLMSIIAVIIFAIFISVAAYVTGLILGVLFVVVRERELILNLIKGDKKA